MKQWTFPSNPQNGGEFITVVCLVQLRLLNLLISTPVQISCIFFIHPFISLCGFFTLQRPKSFSWHQKLNTSEQALVSAESHWDTKLLILQQHASIVDKLRMLLVSLLCRK